mmetsp:Transcript_12822/g.35490  ORF Transcript_12822/g.35490 Transcript_12822/m.35490 type:complete len:492 (-) Transcript_12822:87-1562(-)|eukprot:CAMPEP_0179042430 /NCGR_PEP_ID=MMETSP0796-20121207/16658_1 /TAXON_ID=73915 /ORGANISM="Pyrodinium bahamense, Strain pbaha01" /LENGTH=491 /DNA_ID=CAMNT_0020738805 /DNA_START=119 /DNA_END=1594 /DNA_ORIENTATION=+
MDMVDEARLCDRFGERRPGAPEEPLPDPPPQRPAGGATCEAVEHEVSAGELSKWNEMIETGISQYMHTHPDRFHRRVRRGIPQRFRWQVWKAAVRLQDFEVPKDYHSLSTRENPWTPCIEIDISRTFPELKSFDASQQQRLLRILNAYASHNPNVGYCQGMNYVAGLLLLVSDCEEESFAVLVCLMDHPQFGLSGFYRERLPLLRRYLRACDKLVADTVPELREHFIKENVQPAVYLHQWFLTLFINCFPLSMVMIIWDVIVCEGLPVILRIAVSILQVLKDSLLSMHFEDIIKFFKMMKTYDDEDGDLNAFRIGQLLMKHTEHVQIPERTLEYLNRELADDDGSLDSDESWEADLNSGSWFQSLSRMFTFGSTKRRNNARAPPLAAAKEAAGADASAGGTSAARGTAPPAPAAAGAGSAAASVAATGGSSDLQRLVPMTITTTVTTGNAQAASEASANGAGTGSGAARSGGTSSSDAAEDESLTREWQFL